MSLINTIRSVVTLFMWHEVHGKHHKKIKGSLFEWRQERKYMYKKGHLFPVVKIKLLKCNMYMIHCK